MGDSDGMYYADYGWRTARQLANELAAVTAERDALRKDAERYRWLRDDPLGRSYSVSGIEWSGDSAKADELIDALRRP